MVLDDQTSRRRTEFTWQSPHLFGPILGLESAITKTLAGYVRGASSSFMGNWYFSGRPELEQIAWLKYLSLKRRIAAVRSKPQVT